MFKNRLMNTALFALALAACISQSTAQPCTPRWAEDFAHQGVDRAVFAVQGKTLIGASGLYAAGLFRSAGQVPASRVAVWDGVNWQDMAGGVSEPTGMSGYAYGAMLTTFDEPGEQSVAVGGNFLYSGSSAWGNSFARWNGSEWSSYGGGVWGNDPNCVDCPSVAASSTVYDVGSGPRLFVGGLFAGAGNASDANNIASWDGQEWQTLGTGLEEWVFFPAALALQGYDGTGSPSLYVGGLFFGAGGKPIDHFARWDGTDWHDVAGGLVFKAPPEEFDVGISAMAVFDGGVGESLFVGGTLTEAGDAPLQVSGIARWDGTRWHDVGGGVTTATGEVGHVDAMAVFDDGNGPALYVGGVFEFAGGVPARNIARWDGQQWSALGLGLDDGVRALTVYDLGDGEALYIGGDFLNAGGMPSAHIAKWVGCKQPCPACVCDFDTTTGPQVCDIFDFLTFQNGFVTADPCAIDLDTTTGPGVADIFDFLAFQSGFVAGCP